MDPYAPNPTARSYSPSYPHQKLRVLIGSLSPGATNSTSHAGISDERIQYDQLEESLLKNNHDNEIDDSSWRFQIISFPRVQPGRNVLSIPEPLFERIQQSWKLHSRTKEIFLSNNGTLASFNTPDTGLYSLLFKVASSASIGFDCVSLTHDTSCRTTYVLYHHLSDEDSVFATLLATPERCIDPHFFVSALYQSHHQHLEVHTHTIDETVLGIERMTNFGRPGRLVSSAQRMRLVGPERRVSPHRHPVLEDPKKIIRQLSYCQTDLAVMGHAGRSALDCGQWLVQAIDNRLQPSKMKQLGDNPTLQEETFLKSLRAARMTIRDDVEYTRRRIAMLLSQVEQMKDRTQSQTNFMLSNIAQNDAEYTAAIAVDGKRDSIAVKTISILGIIYLPATFVATLFSVDMFKWGPSPEDAETPGLSVTPDMWIYWAVTVPLTLVTILVWYFWSQREDKSSFQRLGVFRGRRSGDHDTDTESYGSSL
ncbi:hypothetical protein QBC40DRAFT_230273 [Triangularia verruculosa]|uniref:Uncharacterized protein n=1 Tax=Triangularia verruculosa TaxID=2587418 RepID=A0AAN6XF68_9PEZI|nr:hypothetical protein QBC40DRAFT_230273 [Triangularia verruculosa]